jgi:cob(I)alamin adenosyltransferase
VSLQAVDAVKADLAVPYLNRLSDFLFVLARTINRSSDTAEVCRVSHASKINGRR